MLTVLRELEVDHRPPDEHEEHRDAVTEASSVRVHGTWRTVGHPACNRGRELCGNITCIYYYDQGCHYNIGAEGGIPLPVGSIYYIAALSGLV